MQVQCCVCKRVRTETGWEAKVAESAVCSHSYCPQCAEEAFADIRAYHNREQPRSGRTLAAAMRRLSQGLG
ncbi:MAG: hypothetical protein GC168_09425 [Candidatus Hydrogenedens sp.]|nr:hypothetical protein [Candidatus Hydrogenedens sp.]